MVRKAESLVVVAFSILSFFLIASIDLGVVRIDESGESVTEPTTTTVIDYYEVSDGGLEPIDGGAVATNHTTSKQNHRLPAVSSIDNTNSSSAKVEPTSALATTNATLLVASKPSSQTSLGFNSETTSRETKPWMVVHVGPPKTGTSTIQKGLEQRSSQLATNDNVFYVGQLMRTRETVTYFDTPQHPNSNSNSTTAKVRKKLYQQFPMKEFAPGTHVPSNAYFQAIKKHRDQRHNVVLSSEHYTSKFPRNDPEKLFQNIFDYTFLTNGGPKHIRRRRNKDNKDNDEPNVDNTTHNSPLLKDDLSPTFGFDVTIVVAYRHYFQWLPSYYYQSVLINGFKKTNKPNLIEYIETTLNKLGDEYFFGAGDDDKEERPPWSDTVPEFLDKNHGSLYSYFMWSAPASLRHRVELFDMHQQPLPTNNHTTANTNTTTPDLLRDFVCGGLFAATTCSHLQGALDAPLVKRVRVDAGTSVFETGVLSSTHILQLRDAGAERLGIRLKQHQIKNRFLDWVLYHKHNNNDNTNNNNNSTQQTIRHRQLCLGEDSVRLLGAVSWNMLRHLEFLVRTRTPDVRRGHELPLLLSPGPHGGNHRDDDERWWGPIKTAHDELFRDTVERGGYCDLDLDRLFSDPSFVQAVFPAG